MKKVDFNGYSFEYSGADIVSATSQYISFDNGSSITLSNGKPVIIAKNGVVIVGKGFGGGNISTFNGSIACGDISGDKSVINNSF